MQFVNFVLTAIVAGTTLVSGSSPDAASLVPKRHNEIRALDALYGRNNGHISKRHEKKRSKTCRANSAVKSTKSTVKTTEVKSTKSSGKVNISNKAGLCWSQGPYMPIDPYKSATWLYSWKSLPGGDGDADYVPDNMMFFPMLWGNDGQRISDWKKNVLNNRNSKHNKAKVAMGPNEVNQDGQGKMTPGEACDLFRKYIMPLKTESGWSIIGPSTTSAPDGKTWMQSFKKSCPDVYDNIDYDSVHYYGTSSDNAIKYVSDWFNTFKKPIWITEIADMNYDGTSSPSQSEVYKFGEAVMKYVAGADYILGVAWYAPIPENQINIVKFNALSQSNGAASNLWHTLSALL
jgi:Glycosyl hydrolase catalytic core